MKILFVTNSSGPDYMSDIIFHGGKTSLEMYETNKMWYMYDGLHNKEKLYGRGFTLYGKINEEKYINLPDTIENLIDAKFFDKVIFASVWRCLDHFDKVCKVYNKNQLIFIDGEDHGTIKNDLIGKGVYFKREYYNKVDGVHPINFGIPEELVVNEVKVKTKLMSDIIPNDNFSYTYTNEKDYYDEYSSSWYAITRKKAGWDSLRHYEIMMNGTIPDFQDLENCPELTLNTLPKKDLIKMSKLKEKNLDWCNYILDYTKNNLTTKKILEKVVN